MEKSVLKGFKLIDILGISFLKRCHAIDLHLIPHKFSYVKLRHHAALLFCGFLLDLVTGSNSEPSIHPSHAIIVAGNPTVFSCETEITHTAPQWFLSGARQPKTGTVFDGSLKEGFRGKVEVIENVTESMITTQMTIKNVTMHNAGTVFCREDGAFGMVKAAKLSVIVHAIRCTATCVKDHLLVSCYTCYWSEDTLYFIFQYQEYVKPSASSEAFNDSLHCLQMKSIWALNVSCKVFDKPNPVKPMVLLSSDLKNVRKFNLTSEAIHVFVEKRIIDVTTTVNGGMTETGDEEPDNTKGLKIAIGILSVILIIFILLCARVLCLWRKTQKNYKLALDDLYEAQETSRNEPKKEMMEDNKGLREVTTQTLIYEINEEAEGACSQKLSPKFNVKDDRPTCSKNKETTGLLSLQPIRNTDDIESCKGSSDSGFCSLPTHHVEKDACSKGKKHLKSSCAAA